MAENSEEECAVALAAVATAVFAQEQIIFNTAVNVCFGDRKNEIKMGQLSTALQKRNLPMKRSRIRSMVESSGYLSLSEDKKKVLISRGNSSVKELVTALPPPDTNPDAQRIPVHLTAQTLQAVLSPAPVPSIPIGPAPSFSVASRPPITSAVVNPQLSRATTEVNELDFQCDTEAIVDLLGVMAIEEIDLDDTGITDIFIDVGSKMAVKANGEYQQHGHVVTRDDVDTLLENLPGGGPVIEKSNRVIFGHTLHRLAAVAYDGNINGFTIRVGRSVSGLLPLFEGLVEKRNILLCGAPNVGKTTTLREICKHLSKKKCLCLIDTSGEVCGDSENKDRIVGSSRVFRPFNPEHQYMTLLDCVRNHSPDVIAIDELHTKDEVEVCQTIALRSIQMVASVHGNIQDLVFNPMLNKALGGATQALVSDRAAVKNNGKKVVLQRTTRPIFDVVINIKRTSTGLEYQFIEDVANSVTKIMQNKPIKTRTRKIVGGTMEETVEQVRFDFD